MYIEVLCAIKYYKIIYFILGIQRRRDERIIIHELSLVNVGEEVDEGQKIEKNPTKTISNDKSVLRVYK